MQKVSLKQLTAVRRPDLPAGAWLAWSVHTAAEAGAAPVEEDATVVVGRPATLPN